jgi:hypothetical protein
MLAARTYPRVSPGTLREIGKRYTRRPSRRKDDTSKRHRVGVKTTGISPDPQKTTPQTIQSAPPSLPPTNAPPRPCNHHRRLSVDHVARPARQKRGNSCEGSSTVASGRERPPPPSAIADRMQRQGQPGPLARSGLDQARKAPPPHCSKQATVTATQPRGPAPPTAGGTATAPEAAQPDPDGPKGPRSGPVGRRRPRSGDQPAILRLPRQPRHQEAAPPPPETPELRPDRRQPNHAAAVRRASRHHSMRAGKDRPPPPAPHRQRPAAYAGGGGEGEGRWGAERWRLGFAPARPRGGETGAKGYLSLLPYLVSEPSKRRTPSPISWKT